MIILTVVCLLAWGLWCDADGPARLWSWFGFGTPAAPTFARDEHRKLASTVITSVVCTEWSLWDRLRILVSGRTVLLTATKHDAVVFNSVSRHAHGVLAPGAVG